MAADDQRYETPINSLTNQPLPVFFTPEVFEKARYEVRGHHPEHDRSRPELRDEAGILARRSRVYMTPNFLHMGRDSTGKNIKGSYHNVFKGPKVPDDSESKVNIAILNLAQVIPRQAIKLDGGGGYSLKDLTDEEHTFFSDFRITRIENQHRNALKAWFSRVNLGHAVIKYALGQGVKDLLSRRDSERLLNAKSYAVTQELGDLAIVRAVEDMARPAEIIFDSALEEGLVSAHAPRPTLAVTSFLPKHQFRRHYEQVLELFNPNSELALQTGVDTVELEAA